MKHILKQTVYYTFETDSNTDKTVMEDFHKALNEAAGGYFTIKGLEQVGKTEMQLVSLEYPTELEISETYSYVKGFVEEYHYGKYFEFRMKDSKCSYITQALGEITKQLIDKIIDACENHKFVKISYKRIQDSIQIGIVNVEVVSEKV